ncbi:DUF4345 domain-containing protein [Actinoplanes sp. NPDC051861]|uniref:DUF4345 domain-containing protein n=1 Tax=Actinoplanes sp. NPDC051861 TaxID=3155170 RepID=UPI0034234FB6
MNRVVLGLAGAVVLMIGLASLVAPVAFHESNGITGAGTGLLNETRGTGGGLIGLGAIVLAGAFVPRLAVFSAVAGSVVYLGFGLGRVVSLAADGSPGGGLILAAVVEIALGLACGFVLLGSPRKVQ